MKLYRFLFAFLLLTNSIRSQEIAIGQWQSHLPYQKGISVTQDNDKIYYTTGLSIFSIDKSDLSVTFFSKVEGLTDVGINKIEHDPFNDQLFILYANSNIDIVSEREVINIPNIRLNTTIAGDKQVRDIYFESETSSFISTSFGIIVFNSNDKTFGNTILTGVGVNQTTTIDNTIFASTDDGIYYVDRSQTPIIADFTNWELLGREHNLPSLYSSGNLVKHKTFVYASIDNSLFVSDASGMNWRQLHSEPDLALEFIAPSIDRLIVGWLGDNFRKRVLFFEDDGSFIEQDQSCSGVPVDAIVDESGRIWYADLFNDLRVASGYEQGCELFQYNSPFSENVSDIVVDPQSVLVASGGVAENFTYLFSRDGFYLREGSKWQNFNEFSNSQINDFDLLSVFRVGLHPHQPLLYAGSYWAGLLEYNQETEEFVLFNKSNSTLRGAMGDPARERITGLAFDEEDNLWVATYNAPEPINVFTSDREWFSFDTPSRGTLTDVVIDELGNKWFPIEGSNGGVLVYDSGSSIPNRSDDRYRFINSSNSALTTNQVMCVGVDRDGEVWVGTSEGPVIFDCGSEVFEVDRCQGIRKKVLQDSIVAFLLADQQVNTIAFDGANQKWIGTRNGLFVQSEQGDEQIAHYTTDNSPLFDDVIQSLAYEETNGIMWIGTNKGIISLRTESTAGGSVHRQEEVYAFPNPVPPTYSGPIAIKGLVENANVKITDINGRLVKELIALGGQAIWDKMDNEGRVVRSGVYLVFSVDQNAFDRPDSFVTKIMVLNNN